MQPKKVKPREVTKITILVKRLICIALILSYPHKNNPFPNLRAQQSKFGKHSKTIIELNSTTKPNLQSQRKTQQNYVKHRRF